MALRGRLVCRLHVDVAVHDARCGWHVSSQSLLMLELDGIAGAGGAHQCASSKHVQRNEIEL